MAIADVTQPSLEAAVLDAVLVRFAEIVPGATIQRGFTSIDKLVPDSYPFIQAYSPTTASDLAEFGRHGAELVLLVDLIDVGSTSDLQRDRIESLAAELARNPTLGGLVLSAQITTRGTPEISPEDRSSASAVITVQYAEDQLETGDVEILAIAGNAGIINAAGTSLPTLTNSDVIPGALAIEKVAFQTGPKSSSIQFFTLDPLYPNLPEIDWTILTQIRYTLYIPAAAVSEIDLVQIRPSTIFDANVYIAPPIVAGWNEITVDLANPDSTQGTGADFADINIVTFDINWFSGAYATGEDKLLLNRVYYSPRDAGNDVSPGF